MAHFTEMGITPAEPLSYGAAELAFELNEFSSMFWTVFVSSADCYSCAFTTYQFFLFEIIIVIHSITLLHSTEIWILAFETLIV